VLLYNTNLNNFDKKNGYMDESNSKNTKNNLNQNKSKGKKTNNNKQMKFKNKSILATIKRILTEFY
jgi:hypothetical protein